ncbi:diacylglycerol kinase epsilon isoform X2 [Agrilus planipennis]|uniref:Diacylglycerol kinase n=1 Tax=Agrilus planipennis TaxID=224129 RepID=A0A7F5RK87_AGRPL|nr:diacylglycerol kinase epsilon isoform X2 [Agrilus planipennis]
MAIFSKLIKDKPNAGGYPTYIMISLGPSIFPSYGVFIPIVSTILLCVASYYVFKWLSTDSVIPIRDVTKKHNWKTIQISSKPWYCSVCEALLLNGIGVYCDCCGIFSDPDCVKTANKELKCKVVTSKSEEHFHHWIKGNLSLGAMCVVCKEECSVEPGLVDYQCCWCHRTVHTECLEKINKECDFGPFRNMIVPPWCVQVARLKSSIHRHLLLRGVKNPGWKDWCPLIVAGNRKSGNNDGATVLSEFRRYLNPAQVLDLADRPPAAALQWCVLTSPKRLKLLGAGGDGTVAWILTTAFRMDLDPEPPIAILPLGTGNDLSRVLGWGRENPSEVNVPDLLKKIDRAEVIDIDRWRIDVTPYRNLSNLGIRIPSKTLYMYNYFSIGVDAQVALDFHKTRDSKFYIFGSRIFNKLLYLCFGTQQVVTADCKNIEKRLDLYLDGKYIDLPELESIVILNIPSWGAGVDLWGLCESENPQSYNDGILEVVGIYSSFHIAQLQVGLSTPHVLGQARTVENCYTRLILRKPAQLR